VKFSGTVPSLSTIELPPIGSLLSTLSQVSTIETGSFSSAVRRSVTSRLCTVLHDLWWVRNPRRPLHSLPHMHLTCTVLLVNVPLDDACAVNGRLLLMLISGCVNESQVELTVAVVVPRLVQRQKWRPNETNSFPQ